MMSSTAPVKLFGSPTSTCAMRAIFTGHELGFPCELHLVDMAKGEHKSAAHLKRQPFGKVPYCEDGDLCFYESRAICRYLTDKYINESKVQLVPKQSELKKRARFEQWMSLEATTYTPEVSTLINAWIAVKMGGKRDEAACAKAAANLKRDGHVLNEQLAGKQWVANDEFSLVDICLVTYMHPIAGEPEMKQWFADFPNIAAWFKRTTERPAFKKVIEEQKPKK